MPRGCRKQLSGCNGQVSYILRGFLTIQRRESDEHDDDKAKKSTNRRDRWGYAVLSF